MQNFLNTYYIEVIGTIGVIGLLIVILLLRSSQKEQEEPAKTPPTPKPEPLSSLHKETKSEVTPKPLEEPKTAEVVHPTTRKKRELVAHAKIVKEDFESFKGARILIAEDNIINQKVILGLLSGSGIETVVANDGQEALDILQGDRNFSMIFMDAHMPVMDGFQATRAIRQNPLYEQIPVIALSGDTAADDIRNMFNVGMEAHLEKPLKMDALYDILYIYTTGEEGRSLALSKQEEEEIKEFDTHMGLEICGGDKEFYLEILHDFISKYADSAKIIQDYISASNSASASKMLLDISGVAANIGADELHQVAIDLKNSLSSPQDMEYISNVRRYKRSLQQVCEAINEYTSRN